MSREKQAELTKIVFILIATVMIVFGLGKEISYNKVYGNYIILAHTDGRASLYGHLSKVKARLYEKVKSGTIIGNVGSTGLSTGPHLHFEVREQGKAKDPSLFIDTKKTKT